jgi:hypothetical protein
MKRRQRRQLPGWVVVEQIIAEFEQIGQHLAISDL